MVLLADTGCGSRQLILRFTFCCQSISLKRLNALDSVNWILVLKPLWPMKESLALINGHFNPRHKYYIPNLHKNNLWIANMWLGVLVWRYVKKCSKLCLHARKTIIHKILTQRWYLSNQPVCTFTHELLNIHVDMQQIANSKNSWPHSKSRLLKHFLKFFFATSVLYTWP